MKNGVFSILCQRWRELLGFALLFRLLESLLFAPAAGIAAKSLLGRAVLDSTAIVSFVLSPRGFIAVVLAAVTALSIRLLEHAGLSAIFFGGLEGRIVSSRQALRLVWRHLLLLARVSGQFLWVGLLTLLPLLLVAGGLATQLLRQHDVNYYLKFRPPEFITAGVVIGLVAGPTTAVILWLMVRWRWVVQAVLFQQKGLRQAFAQSVDLTRGLRWKLLVVLIGVTLFSLATEALASLVGSGCTSAVLGMMGESLASLAVSFGVLLTLQAIISAGCTFLSSCVDAGVFTSLYRQRVADLGGKASIVLPEQAGQPLLLRWSPVLLTFGLLALAAAGAWLALDAIPEDRTITIHAHRGVSTRAPENTLAAQRDAITAGADYMEADIQLSRDGVLVVTHDNDFSRLGGVAQKVWDLTYDEIRAIPLGRSSAPEFRDEYAPTFDALLAEAKGHIKVNIELKYYGDHQPGLARKVIEAVRSRGMLDQVVVQCLAYEPLLEVRQLAPGVPVGYLLSFNARQPSRLDVNFLSVEQRRIDRAFIQRAHRQGQQVYAWTVDTVKDMERMFDLGVDGIITNQPALARKTLEEFLRRPKPERAVRRVRSWLVD
jgi:glycerophosphoryl diester phosphodiesterase